jgi:hypothetical protein
METRLQPVKRLRLNEQALWVKTRKGYGYLKYDNHSHGVPHSINSDLFWETKRPFMEKYGVSFVNFGGSAPNGRQQIKDTKIKPQPAFSMLYLKMKINKLKEDKSFKKIS